MKVGDTYAITSNGRAAKATVCLIGEAAEVEIVCFYVFDAESFGDDKAKDAGFAGIISHVPVNSEFAVREIGEKIAEGAEIPEAFTESHKTWVESLRAGQAGWFDKTLPNALDQIFSSMIVDEPTS